MTRLCALAVDIDGTITVDRGVFTLDLEAVNALRQVASRGVHVILVTGNGVPVVAGLARYLGFENSPHVAENGCLVFYRGRIYRVCSGDAKKAADLIYNALRDTIEHSWQNRYRECDFAFTLRSNATDVNELLKTARRLLEEHGFSDVDVSYSGYAIHVRPKCVTKSRGLLLALKLTGASPECTIAIGDSSIDAELKGASRILVAVSNADPELKRRADIVLREKSGKGVVKLVKLLLNSNLEIEELLKLVERA